MGKGLQILHRVQTGFTLIEILVVVAILGALTAVVIPNIVGMMHHGEVEAMETEKHNVQVAVYSMMITAGVVQLDSTSSYNEIDELDEVHSVTATHPRTGVTYYLDDYLHGGHYPLLQPYEISIDGHVSVDQDTQTTV